MTFDLTYAFEPGTDADGVTVHLPLLVLNQVTADGFEWSVPGFREELVTTLIKSLPKAIRRNIVPAPDHARQILPHLDPASGPLIDAMARELRSLRDVIIEPEDWDWTRVPEHLRMTFRVIDDHGKTVAEGKDLAALKERLKPKTKAAISQVASKAVSGLERSGLTDWTFGDLPRSFSEHRNGLTVAGYPALVDEGKSVAIRLQETERDQAAAMWTGTRKLLLLTMPSVIDVVQRNLTNQQKMTLMAGPHRNVGDLLDDAISAAVDELMAKANGPAWNLTGFAILRDAVRSDLADTVLTILKQVEQVLAHARTVDKQISRVVESGAAGRAVRRTGPAGSAHPSGVHHRGRRQAAARSGALPARDRAAARQDRRQRDARPLRDGGRPDAHRRVREAVEGRTRPASTRARSSSRSAGCSRNSGSVCSPRRSVRPTRSRRSASGRR